MNQKLVSAVIARKDLEEAQAIIANEQRKLRELAIKVANSDMDKGVIVNELLDIDVSAGVNHLLSCDVVL